MILGNSKKPRRTRIHPCRCGAGVPPWNGPVSPWWREATAAAKSTRRRGDCATPEPMCGRFDAGRGCADVCERANSGRAALTHTYVLTQTGVRQHGGMLTQARPGRRELYARPPRNVHHPSTIIYRTYSTSRRARTEPRSERHATSDCSGSAEPRNEVFPKLGPSSGVLLPVVQPALSDRSLPPNPAV